MDLRNPGQREKVTASCFGKISEYRVTNFDKARVSITAPTADMADFDDTTAKAPPEKNNSCCGKLRTCQIVVWKLLNDPTSSTTALVWSVVLSFLIILSVAAIVVEPMTRYAYEFTGAE